MFYLLLVVAGIALAGYGAIAYRRGLARYRVASATWQQGVATITESWLQQTETSTNDGSTISYRARVAYRYLVGGVEHVGTRPFLCARVDFASELNGKKWLAQVPAGSTVPVWYDPAKPDEAALELNRPSLVLVTLLGPMGILLAAMGLFLFFK